MFWCCPRASGAVIMALAVPASGQSVCVGGMVIVSAAITGMIALGAGKLIPAVGVALFVTGAGFILQAVNKNIKQIPARESK